MVYRLKRAWLLLALPALRDLVMLGRRGRLQADVFAKRIELD